MVVAVKVAVKEVDMEVGFRVTATQVVAGLVAEVEEDVADLIVNRVTSSRMEDTPMQFGAPSQKQRSRVFINSETKRLKLTKGKLQQSPSHPRMLRRLLAPLTLFVLEMRMNQEGLEL